MDIFDALIGVGGTVVGSIGTLYATKRQEKRSDFSELVDRWKVYTDEISKELSELREEYKTMKDQEHKCAENLRAVQYEITMLKQQVQNLGAQ
jgi:predicted  nucleic acid-binding Zn-ribbon protein